MESKSFSARGFTPDALRLSQARLFERYGIHADGVWTQDALQVLDESSFLFFGLAPKNYALWSWAENLSVRLEPMQSAGLTSKNLIRLNPSYLTNWTVIHELAHAWDAAWGWRLSAWFARQTGSRFSYSLIHRLFPESEMFWYSAGSPPPPCGRDAHFNRLEDFAESISAFLYPEEAKKRAEQRGWGYERFGYSHFHETPRGKLIRQLIQSK